MLNNEILNKFKEEYYSDEVNRLRRRMLNKVPLIDLVQDNDTEISSDFNINIKTHQVTDQKNSARCWSFAAMNILREKVIENCELDNFELSGSYVAFYDKLENFNILLERLIIYKKSKKDLYDRYLSQLLEWGIGDEGYFTQFANLVCKYGIVPKSVFPETFSSSNTYEINAILSRLLRMFYLELDKTVEVENLKNKYLETAFCIIANVYGVPPEKFDFEYIDKNGKYHIIKDVTPKEFYDKYIGIDLINDYIEVTSYEDEKIKYNNVYESEETSGISGKSDIVTLNLPQEDFEELLIKQIKNQELVYFYCSTTSKKIDGLWIDTMEKYGEIFGIDLTLDKNDILKTNGITGCHCMLITGVHIVDGEIKKWKIENSWGSKVGNQGYYVATNDWVKKYVHRIVINKKLLEKEHQDVLKQKVIKLDRWSDKI